MAFESNAYAYAHDGSGFNYDGTPASGDILSGLAVSAGGNIAGAIANGGLNYLLQENQFEHQKQLQDRAAQKNAQAVADQAQLQKLGMENAGLSPAPVQGTGAPSLQAGAAAGASAQMANIFAGLAELVQAIKAPTEIEKSVAETGLAGSQARKADAEAEKVGTDVEQYRDYNSFMKKQGPSMFEKQKAALEQAIVREWTDDDGVKHTESLWDFLSDETKSTWQKIIDGEIPFTVGRFKAMMDDIEAQAKLAEVDDRMVTSATHLGILLEKVQDPKALQALIDQEKNDVRRLEQEVKESKSRSYANYKQGELAGVEATKLRRETPTKEQSAALNAARVKLMQTEAAKKIQEMDMKAFEDWKYLVSKGRWSDAAMVIFGNATEEAIDLVKNLIPWVGAIRSLKGTDLLKKSPIPSAGSDSPGGIIRPPFNSRGATFDNYMDWTDKNKEW